MIPNDQKLKLLDTRITELGLGKGIEKLFGFDMRRNPIATKDILTVKQFIKLNSKVSTKGEFLICTKTKEKVLNQQTTSAKVIINFLREAGLTETDWIVLAVPVVKIKEEKIVINGQTDKEVLKKLPYTQVCGLYPKSKSTKWINRILELCAVPDKEVGIYTLGNLLQLSKENIMSTFYNPELPVEAFIRITPSLRRAQVNLDELGFTEQHGPFMSIPSNWFSKKATVCSNETVLQRVKGGQLELGFTTGKSAHLPGVGESAMVG